MTALYDPRPDWSREDEVDEITTTVADETAEQLRDRYQRNIEAYQRRNRALRDRYQVERTALLDAYDVAQGELTTRLVDTVRRDRVE